MKSFNTDSFRTEDYYLYNEAGAGQETALYHVVTRLQGEEVLLRGPLLVLLVQLVSSWVAYIFGKFACKGKIQEFCYALPLSLLVTPISFFTATQVRAWVLLSVVKEYQISHE